MTCKASDLIQIAEDLESDRSFRIKASEAWEKVYAKVRDAIRNDENGNGTFLHSNTSRMLDISTGVLSDSGQWINIRIKVVHHPDTPPKGIINGNMSVSKDKEYFAMSLGIVTKEDAKSSFFRGQARQALESTFVHEYIHFLDHSVRKTPAVDTNQFTDIGDYLSSPPEFNAWFQHLVHDFMVKAKVANMPDMSKFLIKGYDHFRKVFLHMSDYNFDKLSEARKKRFLKRLYALYHELRSDPAGAIRREFPEDKQSVG